MWELSFLLVAAVIGGPPAFATKSRLEALNQDSMGSFFVKDERNIFLNPAYIHKIDRRINLEWGDDGGASKTDTVAAPKAEGGWFENEGSFPYTIYLGNEDNESISFRNLAGTSASGTFLMPDNTLDFTWGMGSGSANRWGLGATLSNNKDETTVAGVERSETFVGFRAGVLVGEEWEFYSHLALVDEAEGAAVDNDGYKGKLGLKVGAIYNLDKYRIWGQIHKKDSEYEVVGGTSQDLNAFELTVGAGHTEELSSRHAFLIWFAQLERESLEQGASVSHELETTQLLAGFGVEGQVKRWLSLRGSIKQGVLLNDQTNKTTGTPSTSNSIADSATVAGGMSVLLNGFYLDGSFTTTAGTLNAGNIMSRVAMSYVY
ncbi:MAG: hypothetical protein IPJ71_13080 [Bdellovibrionales bacterium]|nr:hypothetical protein [Bdellovibrionales bacterium]